MPITQMAKAAISIADTMIIVAPENDEKQFDQIEKFKTLRHNSMSMTCSDSLMGLLNELLATSANSVRCAQTHSPLSVALHPSVDH
jgi:hypothetical protein